MTPIIAVHGFMYDPADIGGSNDPASFFQEMSGIAGRPVSGFSWYSVPFGLRAARPFHSVYQTARAWLTSWARGRLHPYRLAWDLSLKAAADLRALILDQHGPVDIMAHSLGVRVALHAMKALPDGKVRRVIFFNGAELAEKAESLVWLLPPDVRILNLAISCDRVLEYLGSYFNGDDDAPCVGRVGLKDPPHLWRDVFLDDKRVQAAALEGRGWTLRADSPDDLLDHGESYHFAGNADLVRAWLAGDPLLFLRSRMVA